MSSHLVFTVIPGCFETRRIWSLMCVPPWASAAEVWAQAALGGTGVASSVRPFLQSRGQVTRERSAPVRITAVRGGHLTL